MTADRMSQLLQPYLSALLPQETLQHLLNFLELLQRWNARTNLTAIRDEDTLVQRQIGESLWCVQHIPVHCTTLLDFGSGAGFPGIPIALLRPHILVTLAESQGKKASFLREAIRLMNLTNTQVWPGRVQGLPAEVVFDVVAMRAVDDSDRILPEALARVAATGTLLRFAPLESAAPADWEQAIAARIPLLESGLVGIRRVSRGTLTVQ